MGVLDIPPDQIPTERIKRTIINRITGETLPLSLIPAEKQPTNREKEILLLICEGFLSKEIAYKLNISLYTVNNHRKNILAKLDVDNLINILSIFILNLLLSM
ncbi:MAG: LuxR C-terminal-related transcriptional regulator [Paludibacteraceae bacterium]